MGPAPPLPDILLEPELFEPAKGAEPALPPMTPVGAPPLPPVATTGGASSAEQPAMWMMGKLNKIGNSARFISFSPRPGPDCRESQSQKVSACERQRFPTKKASTVDWHWLGDEGASPRPKKEQSAKRDAPFGPV
jgi:hypothetical protein